MKRRGAEEEVSVGARAGDQGRLDVAMSWRGWARGAGDTTPR